MSLDKAIIHGKEKRKEYRGAKAVAYCCRNHGDCMWCQANRTHATNREIERTDYELKEYYGELT